MGKATGLKMYKVEFKEVIAHSVLDIYGCFWKNHSHDKEDLIFLTRYLDHRCDR
jgi:hypothetical protein